MLDGFRRMPTDPAVLSDLGLADWDAVRTLLIGNQGVCELWTGATAAAREHLFEAARVDGNRSLALSTLNAQAHLAYLHWADGELTAAQELAGAAVQAFTELQVPGAVQARSAYLALAGVALDRDERERARRWLQVARQGAHEPHTAFATEVLSARLLEADGKPFDAIAALRDARDRAAAQPIASPLIEESLQLENRLLTLAGSTTAAQQVQASSQEPAVPQQQTLRARVEQHLDRARQAHITSSRQRALDELERALQLAAPEQLRRPFLTAGDDIGQLISSRIQLGTKEPTFVADLEIRMNSQATEGHRDAVTYSFR